MNYIYIFEDRKSDGKYIKNLVDKLINPLSDKFKSELNATVQGFCMDTFSLGDFVITDLFDHRHKELKLYWNIVSTVEGLSDVFDESEYDESLIEKLDDMAEKILINKSIERFIKIAEVWKRTNRPIIILTITPRPILAKIFKEIRKVESEDIQKMFENQVDDIIEDLEKKLWTIYQYNNIIIFPKVSFPDAYLDEEIREDREEQKDKEVQKNNEHKKFIKSFSDVLTELLK